MIDANEFITIFDDSNIERIVNHEYLYYLSDIQCKSFFINNVKIKWKRFPTVDEKDATFFHLITVGYKDRDTYCCPNRSIHCIRDFKYQPMMGEEYSLEQKRTICGFRIQSLPLLIKTFQKQDNLIWEEVRSTHSGKKTRIDILNQENKYFVVLEKRKSGDVLLWTAFPVTRERISDLKRAYKAKKDPKAIYTLMVK